MSQLILIEREGVLQPPGGDALPAAENFRAIPGSLEAVARLNHAGLHVALLARLPERPMEEGGEATSIEALNRLHARLGELLARRGGHLDGLFIFTSEDDEPGNTTLQTVCERFSLNHGDITLIGNAPQLIDALRTAGARAFRVVANEDLSATADDPNDPTFPSLALAVEYLLKT